MNVYDIVKKLREDRGGAVQTYEQLEVVYRTCARYARKIGLLSSFYDENIGYAALEEAMQHIDRSVHSFISSLHSLQFLCLFMVFLCDFPSVLLCSYFSSIFAVASWILSPLVHSHGIIID